MQTPEVQDPLTMHPARIDNLATMMLALIDVLAGEESATHEEISEAMLLAIVRYSGPSRLVNDLTWLISRARS